MDDFRTIFQTNLSNPGHCLLLRPFGPKFDRIWGSVHTALKETFNWKDVASFHEAGDIMHDVLLAIACTDAVIVDITEDNPNVFYELGIAHMTKGEKKVVIVRQAARAGDPPKRKRPPFDISRHRYLEYKPNSEGIQAMLPKLEKHIWSALEWTTWFRLEQGKTHCVEALPGPDGDYELSVRVGSLSGKELGPPAVGVEMNLRPFPVHKGSSSKIVKARMSKGETCQIPHLPWRLKFEGIERKGSKAKAIICIIPAEAIGQSASMAAADS